MTADAGTMTAVAVLVFCVGSLAAVIFLDTWAAERRRKELERESIQKPWDEEE